MKTVAFQFLGIALAHSMALVPQADPEPPPANYVAHEWGTFTSMVGTGGVVLDGMHHEEEALPGFVHDLLGTQAYGVTCTKLPASRVTQKMETPVIYFYTDEPQAVNVSVWFQEGLMTQFYPLPTTIYPELADALIARAAMPIHKIDMGKIEGSMLTWDIDVLPRSEPAPKDIPLVDKNHPWALARQTRSAWVCTRPEVGSPARGEAEHYLFYRGLGRWQPAVTLEVNPLGRALLGNSMPQAIPFQLALELGARGGRFHVGRAVQANDKQAVDLGSAPWIADREHFARLVGATVMQALVKQGLYLDEARAMVATWSRSWFQNDGARIIYLLPREQIDDVLPLWFQPRPKELVRVMVGRLEFITPEAQQRVEQALLDDASGAAAAQARAASVFADLGRFLEPHLRNIAANGTTKGLRRAASARLDEPGR